MMVYFSFQHIIMLEFFSVHITLCTYSHVFGHVYLCVCVYHPYEVYSAYTPCSPRARGVYVWEYIYMCYTPCRGGIIDLYHNEDSI